MVGTSGTSVSVEAEVSLWELKNGKSPNCQCEFELNIYIYICVIKTNSQLEDICDLTDKNQTL